MAAGWAWLATLPRAATAHAARGDDPQAAVRALLAALGNPHHGLRVIHIAGSKGKGSTALQTEALLEALGQRTFTFTSPHLQRWTERLRLGGDEAPGAQALAALEAVRDASERTGVVPGFFEALTVAGLHLAATAGVDWCVIECGVGGRADATNVVRPAATIITGIELEHVDRLGNTLEAIAAEKAGIVKPGAALIAPRLPESVDRILEQRARAADVPFVRVERASRPPSTVRGATTVLWHLAGDGLTAAGPGWRIRTGLASAGEHMAGNATLALTAVAQLGLASPQALQRAARRLAERPLPGRMETLSRLPWVIVDSAHTAASAAALATSVQALEPPRLHLLLSCSAGKDIDAILAALLPIADAVTLTRADPDYSMPPATLLEHLRASVGDAWPPAVFESPDDALAHASADDPGRTLVLATGSVYLAGRVRAAFHA